MTHLSRGEIVPQMFMFASGNLILNLQKVVARTFLGENMSETFSIDQDWAQAPVAFKEWQVVCDALLKGEQSIILRKGGIAEGRAGFEWKQDRFLLFPTLFHEQSKLVRPHADGSERTIEHAGADADRPAIDFGLYVEAVSTGKLSDWSAICELEPFHIWNRETIRERFDWGDEPAISYAVVRVAALKEPWVLENRRSFGGCRSWINLPADEAGGLSDRAESIEWVDPVCGLPNL